MKAVLLGATGATGKEVLELLLQDANYHQVDIFVRRTVALQTYMSSILMLPKRGAIWLLVMCCILV